MKRKRATLALVCALSLPVPAAAAGIDDMFGVMFRMMLVMMNVMSDAMLGNNDGFGSSNPMGVGMGGWPAMSGMPGMTPWSGMGGMPGMTPWSGMGGMPGMTPWSGMGGMPGMTPWSGMGGFPGNNSAMSPWSTPFMGDRTSGPNAGAYPPHAAGPYNQAGYGGPPGAPATLLEGRWYGYTGEVLEVRGNRFRLQHGQYGVSGAIRIENNLVNLFNPENGTVTRYTFIRNQSDLMLQDATGQVLSFTRRPGRGAVHVF